MKFLTSLALALTVLAATTSAAPSPSPSPADAIGGLLQSLTNAAPLGGLAGAAGQPMTETASPSSPILRKRHGRSHADAVLNAIVSINTKVVAKALINLKAHLCSDIHAKIHVVATGLLTADTDIVVPKISAKVETETHSAINTKVDTDAKVLVLDKIRQHGHECLMKRCPYLDDRCFRKHAREIVQDVEALVKVDVAHLFVALKINLMTHVRARIEVLIRKLGVNLLLEQIHIQGKVDAVAELTAHLDMCSHIIVKGLHVTVLPTAVTAIRTICRGN